ncbi:hypothetical protein KSS87_012582 [Heliosperma pusillum]|nr:hypothetical protein KSS87_012582 [Heliosperma pusillum]
MDVLLKVIAPCALEGAPCASFSWEPIASVRLAPHETKLTYKPNPCGIVKWIISKALEVDEIFNNHSKGALPIALGLVWISKWEGKGREKAGRQRQDDIWEHDLFDDNRPHIQRKLGGGDLRLKLQRKNSQQDTRGGGVRDLRDLLSGSMHLQQVKKDVAKPKPTLDAPKPTRRNVVAESPVADVKKVPSAPSNKKPLQKADASVDGFLQSLGLEKYQITFQAEEVDMTALEHMTDEDLKAMGIPMRFFVLYAISSTSYSSSVSLIEHYEDRKKDLYMVFIYLENMYAEIPEKYYGCRRPKGMFQY